ncbi:NAD(P)/FAD-dependent oxidoreductase [Miltoncostaea oceani]|uniref:NAD(P)/FAD-dependent oxidoreductase n=1 Tax=Miltoncostaea oceani TaxID=2843216 RepID=UPI001C3C4F2C|nr:NAD(P)/FAD-dependent oxidoreductase [Miltoncostaea oceani]
MSNPINAASRRAPDSQERERIVIIGGGFAGFYCALAAERHNGGRLHVTLVSELNHLVYTPFLPEAAAGTLEPRHVVVPMRGTLGPTRFVLGAAVSHDPVAGTISVRQPTGNLKVVEYDRLLITPGSITRVFPIPGLREHAVGCKTLAEAVHLRNQVLRQLELADASISPHERRRHLNFVFVGGGYAGVEALAEMEDLVRAAMRLYPSLRDERARFVLVEATGRIFPEVGEGLSDYSMAQLRERGIELRMNTQLVDATGGRALLSDGEEIPTDTLVWTAGVRPHPCLEALGMPLNERGQVLVDEFMRVGGYPRIFAAGDCAAVPDPARPGMSCPPTAQHAIRQGRLAGRNFARVAAGEEPKPFNYKTRGVFVNLGRYKGVARFGQRGVKGLLAWVATRLYHLSQIPGTGRKARVLADWSLDLLCRRDTAELGTLGRPEPLERRVGPRRGPEARREP